MQRLLLILLAFCSISLFTSCDSKAKTANQSEAAQPIKSNKPSPNSELARMRDRAISTIDFRINEGKPGVAQILDVGLWEYKFTFDGEMTKPGELDGNWIDFDEKGNYAYGLYDKEKGSGIYHFHPDDMRLLMVDNDENKKPQEFILKLANGAMIMQGQNTYGDRSTQSKLDHLMERPTK